MAFVGTSTKHEQNVVGKEEKKKVHKGMVQLRKNVWMCFWKSYKVEGGKGDRGRGKGEGGRSGEILKR